MATNKYLMGIDTRIKPNLLMYGETKKIPTLAIGLILDLVIPFTFGSISFLLNKFVGKNIKITIHNEVLN